MREKWNTNERVRQEHGGKNEEEKRRGWCKVSETFASSVKNLN